MVKETEPAQASGVVVVYTGGVADRGSELTKKRVRLLVLFLPTQKPLLSQLTQGPESPAAALALGGPSARRPALPVACMEEQAERRALGIGSPHRRAAL